MSPSEIKLSTDRRSMELVWPDGSRGFLAAATLRRMSRSAEALAAQLAGTFAEPSDELTIQSVQLVGVYAINVIFSDGYARGIYPWAMLREASAGDFSANGN